MKFHWMHRLQSNEADFLGELMQTLNDSGYYSVMFPYDPFMNDWMLKVLPFTKKEQELKYIFALRTYAISPEYTAMMFQQFNEYFPNKALINVLAGDKAQMEYEKDVRGALVDFDFFDNVEKRIQYTEQWLEKFVNLPILKYKPEIIMTGVSNPTLANVKKYGDYSGCMMDAYKDFPERYNSVSKNRLALVYCYITDTEEEYSKALELSKNEESFYTRFTMFGNYDQIINEIKNLKDLGLTDLMFARHELNKDDKKIHQFVKYVTENNLL